MRRILLAIAAVAMTAAAASAAVKVEQGLVEGVAEDGLTVYRGIPFAAPPVGDLRWRAPQPPAKWKGVRQADKYAPYCMQSNVGPTYTRSTASEDCLYLNVWTPAKTAKDKVPVLGDLPLLGRLFQSQTKTLEKKNLMIFVTATIVDPAGNRVHSDDELPFNPLTIPVQPVGAATLVQTNGEALISSPAKVSERPVTLQPITTQP